MDHNVLVSVNNESVELIVTKTLISVGTRSIPFSDVKSIHVKSDGAQHFLRISSEEDLIIRFESVHLRDLVKNLILHAKGSKDDGYEIFFKYPLLINVFMDLNLTIQQFANYYYDSYFYNPKKKRNCIDVILDKYFNYQNSNFASRINEASFMALKNVRGIDAGVPSSIKSVVNFEPIYLDQRPAKRLVKNNFNFEVKITDLRPELEIEPGRRKNVFKKEDLKRLLDLRRDKKDMTEYLKKLFEEYGSGNMKYLNRIVGNIEMCEKSNPINENGREPSV